MAIDLTLLEKRPPVATRGEPNPRVVDEDRFTYRDIRFDLELGKLDSTRDFASKNTTDIASNDNVAAIEQSIQNILGTTPGEKLLNPYLGLDLRHFLFDPITKNTADRIARAVLNGLAQQEPRVTVSNINVAGIIERDEYEITIAILIPNLNNHSAVVVGSLTSNGFKFKN